MPSASSTRVWLACGLVTAGVVTGVLVFSKPRDAGAGTRPPPPPPITEPEVRTYLLVKPGVNAILEESFAEFRKNWRPGQTDSPELGEKNRMRIETLVQGQHLTLDDWHRLERRVERVVNLLRGEAEFEVARPGIVERLGMKKEHLKTLPRDDKGRADVEREIRDAEALLKSGPEKVSQEDREIALRYWASLDKLVPTVGPMKPG